MRLSTAVLAVSCVVMGYPLVGSRVNAQDDHSPVRRFPSGMGVGTRVLLRVADTPNPRDVDCTIARIDAGWVRCADPDGPAAKSAFGPTPPETWYDLAHVVWMQKAVTDR